MAKQSNSFNLKLTIIVVSCFSISSSFAAQETPYNYAKYLSSGKILNSSAKKALARSKANYEKSKKSYQDDQESHDGDFYYGAMSRKKEFLKSYSDWKKASASYGSDIYLDKISYLKMKKHVDLLSKYEVAELINYSEWGYQSLNGFLWNPKKYIKESKKNYLGQEEEFKESLINLETHLRVSILAMQKLPSLSKNTALYRCDTGTIGSTEAPSYVKDFFKKEEVGETHLFRSFKSTTYGLYIAARSRYVDNCRYLRVITTSKNSRSRDIYAFSTRREEEEVLFLPNTYFKTTKFESVQKFKQEINFENNTLSPTKETFQQRILYMTECQSAKDC